MIGYEYFVPLQAKSNTILTREETYISPVFVSIYKVNGPSR